MKKILALMIVLSMAYAASAETLSYTLALDYDSGKLSLKNIELVNAVPPKKAAGNEYMARIMSYKNENLYETTFSISLVKFYGLPISKETAILPPEELNETTVDLLIPYYPNAKSLQILKKEALLLEVDLSRFSTCNENNICDGSESSGTCPSDCTCGNNVCEPSENYMTCFSDCGPGQKAIPQDSLLYGAAVVVIVVAAFAIWNKKIVHKKSK